MIAAVYHDDPRLAPLIGPGGQFEVEETVLDGVPLRVFVRAPRTILDTFAMGANHAELVHLVHDDERLTFARGWVIDLLDLEVVGGRFALRALGEQQLSIHAAQHCAAVPLTHAGPYADLMVESWTRCRWPVLAPHSPLP